ncbi:hypothetical protein GCM10009801_40690 [Streptomyces albiaxialis]|uniref:LigA protein n=1 Tax=Streptomyces albiaxialis TaxID=329523 RepID=A0ABN2W4G9_9ACTN
MTKSRNALLALVPLACLPYLLLKVSWLCGGTAGIPEGSTLRDGGGTLWALNLLTVAMDATVILLAVALARPWGQRLPAPLMAVPLWGASGLLGPILVAFPVQTVHGWLTGGTESSGGGSNGGSDGKGADALLDDWVWATVYTGFSVQGIVLGTLFVLYVRERWGTLRRARVRTLPGPTRPSARTRTALSAAVLGALPLAVMYAMRAAGSTTGLAPEQVEQRDASTHIVELTYLFFILLAVAGTAWLVLGRGNPRLWKPLAAAWAGSGVMACWGGWLLMGVLSGGGRVLGDSATVLAQCAYGLQMAVGLLLAALTARALIRHGGTGVRTRAEVRTDTGAGAEARTGARADVRAGAEVG